MRIGYIDDFSLQYRNIQPYQLLNIHQLHLFWRFHLHKPQHQNLIILKVFESINRKNFKP